MNKANERQSPSRTTRIIFGLMTGAVAAASLECVNGILTFLLPPLIVLTPVCLIGGVLLAWVVGSRQSRAAKRASIADLDIPPSIQALIRDIVRRTRLWLSEKHDVRAELKSHFRDAIGAMTEAGLPADEAARRAVEQFGNPRLAARLIRRGKKRARPVIWKAFVATCRGFVLTLLAIAAYIGWIFTGRPTLSVDYVARINAPVDTVPESERAWPILKQIILNFQPMPDELDEQTDRFAYLTPADELWPAATAWVQANRRFVDDIRRAAHRRALGYRYDNRESRRFTFEMNKRRMKPGASYEFVEPKENPEFPRVMSILLPPLAGCREVAKFLALNARVHLASGELDAAWDSLDTAHRMGFQLLPGGTLIEQLVGAAIVNLSTEDMRTLLYETQGKLTPTDVRALRAGHLMTASSEAIRTNLTSEQYNFEDMVQCFFTDNGCGDGHLIGTKVARYVSVFGSYDAWSVGVVAIHAGRKETLAKYHELWNQMDNFRRLPLYDPARAQADKLIEKLNSDPVQRYRYRLIAEMMPSLDRADQLIRETRMNESATQTVIALLAYRAKHGRFPDRLEALVPDYAASVPIDVYTGAALRYSVDANGQMRLYSVWRNLVDDHGQKKLIDQPSASPRSDIAYSEKNPADMVYWPAIPPSPPPPEPQASRPFDVRGRGN